MLIGDMIQRSVARRHVEILLVVHQASIGLFTDTTLSELIMVNDNCEALSLALTFLIIFWMEDTCGCEGSLRQHRRNIE